MDAYVVEEDVFGLDVAVDDLLGVHVLEALADLPQVAGGLRLCHLALLLHLHQRTVGHGLKHQVDVGLVAEAAEQRGEVPVLQEGLDLYLPQQMLLHLHLGDLLLLQLLQHHHKASSLLLGHIHISERALADLVQQLKIVNAEGLAHVLRLPLVQELQRFLLLELRRTLLYLFARFLASWICTPRKDLLLVLVGRDGQRPEVDRRWVLGQSALRRWLERIWLLWLFFLDGVFE